MDTELISIIIPVYNVEPYLRRCLDSVINQTYKNLEIILVDDGSTDKSGEICEEYKKKDSRIIVIHQKNQGLSAARNAGLDIFKGDYVSFIDSDDYVDLKFIETLYMLISASGASISLCSYYIKNRFFVFDDKLVNYNYLIKREIDVAWAKLYKSFIFANLRFPVGKIHEDRYIFAQALFAAKIIMCTSKILYHYCQRSNSITETAKLNLTFDSEISILASIRFISSIDIEEQIISNAFSEVLFSIYYKILNNKIDKSIKKDSISYLHDTYKIIKPHLSYKTVLKFHLPYLFVKWRTIKTKK